jgi:hypothetical protein
VYIRSAAKGKWRVTIRGANIPEGPQPFALIVDGALVPKEPKPPETYASLLPAVFGPAPVSGDATGTVTAYGDPVAGLTIELRFDDGYTFAQTLYTQTDARGRYRFADQPPMNGKATYYVRWNNHAGNDAWLSTWACWEITSTTTDPAALRCDFDIADVPLVSPRHNRTIALPQTFSWQPRAIAGDDYELNLADMEERVPHWHSDRLGHSGAYTLTTRPSGFQTDVAYGWWIWVYGEDGYGMSHYYRLFQFGSSANDVQEESGSTGIPLFPEQAESLTELRPAPKTDRS